MPDCIEINVAQCTQRNGSTGVTRPIRRGGVSFHAKLIIQIYLGTIFFLFFFCFFFCFFFLLYIYIYLVVDLRCKRMQPPCSPLEQSRQHPALHPFRSKKQKTTKISNVWTIYSIPFSSLSHLLSLSAGLSFRPHEPVESDFWNGHRCSQGIKTLVSPV